MRYLLDTNIFLWWLNNDKRLKDPEREIIRDIKNQIFVSVASAWEISIKHKTGKLSLKTSLKTCFEVSGLETLSIDFKHVLELNKLRLYHKDPFDRMLVSQAKVENLTFITGDKKIWRYNVDVLKC